MKLKWETVEHDRIAVVEDEDFKYSPFTVLRASVPGGWLVFMEDCLINIRGGEAVKRPGGLTFVPDPEHGWQ